MPADRDDRLPEKINAAIDHLMNVAEEQQDSLEFGRAHSALCAAIRESLDEAYAEGEARERNLQWDCKQAGLP